MGRICPCSLRRCLDLGVQGNDITDAKRAEEDDYLVVNAGAENGLKRSFGRAGLLDHDGHFIGCHCRDSLEYRNA